MDFTRIIRGWIEKLLSTSQYLQLTAMVRSPLSLHDLHSLTPRQKPPKRRPQTSAPAPPPDKKPRQSKLAKENNISAATESEILEAFSLFSTPSSPSEKHGLLPSPSLRRALTALGVPPTSSSELKELLSAADPTDSGTISYEHFVAIAALKLENRSEQSKRGEVEDAFRLFSGGRERITVEDLKRVARELKESVGEGVLGDMVLEANGGEGVGRGVDLHGFEGVMRRAGVFR